MMTAELISSRWSCRGFCANGAGSTTDSSGQQAKRVSWLKLTQNFERPPLERLKAIQLHQVKIAKRTLRGVTTLTAEQLDLFKHLGGTKPTIDAV